MPYANPADAKAWQARRYVKNRDEMLAYNTRYRARPEAKAQRKDRELQQKYGISLADYDQMLTDQGGGCAACGRKDRRLVVDHCHKTGRVRGILCDECNLMAGYLEHPDRDLVDAYLGNPPGLPGQPSPVPGQPGLPGRPAP